MKQTIFIIILVITITNCFYHKDIGIKEATRIRRAEETGASLSRIAGGVYAYPGQYPFFAGLIIEIDSNTTSVCGASLISNTKLVTAAHCWFDGFTQAQSIVVVLGSIRLFTGGTRIQTTDVTIHNNYDPLTIRNDIAIVTINKIDFNSYIQPISLSADEMFENISCQVIGFGRIGDDVPIVVNQQLSQAAVSVISNSDCSVIYGQLITESLICTSGNGYIGPCGGDSGGPMFYRTDEGNFLVGIVSFGSSYGCEFGHPTSYTRVTSFLGWIQGRL